MMPTQHTIDWSSCWPVIIGGRPVGCVGGRPVGCSVRSGPSSTVAGRSAASEAGRSVARGNMYPQVARPVGGPREHVHRRWPAGRLLRRRHAGRLRCTVRSAGRLLRRRQAGRLRCTVRSSCDGSIQRGPVRSGPEGPSPATASVTIVKEERLQVRPHCGEHGTTNNAVPHDEHCECMQLHVQLAS